ncbi:MAG: ribonuclease P protein component [Dehalococcoidia bacterium]|nr:ribonuclease P protein component [Dehalococcoidia bacterium]
MSRLGRARRLRKGPEFERVFKEGVAIGGPFLLVRTIANDVGHVRWGFAAGKKVFPGSPARNRMRRRMKAAAVELDAEGGVDVVVVARSAAAGMEFERLVDELQRQLRRVGYVVARREL